MDNLVQLLSGMDFPASNPELRVPDLRQSAYLRHAGYRDPRVLPGAALPAHLAAVTVEGEDELGIAKPVVIVGAIGVGLFLINRWRKRRNRR